jgi:hypothetical protein
MKTFNMKNNYVLFIYANHPESEKLYNSIRELMSTVIKDDINFTFSPDSAIFTFSTPLEILDIYVFMDELLDSEEITFFLFPLDLGNMVIKSSDELYEHLFGRFTTKMTSMDENTNENDLEQLKRMEEFLNTIEYEEEDEDLLIKLRKQKVKPSVDDILDKIIESGMDSLTKEEKKLLETYSKQS